MLQVFQWILLLNIAKPPKDIGWWTKVKPYSNLFQVEQLLIDLLLQNLEKFVVVGSHGPHRAQGIHYIDGLETCRPGTARSGQEIA